MADSESKFYWIKLKTDFFGEDSPMDFLLGKPNGSEYVALYIKLCLATANTGGRLCNQFGEIIIPYDVEKIQRDMKFFSIDTIRVALTLYKQLGLIYEERDGILAITDYSNMVGSETKYAEKMRKYREGVKEREAAGYIVAGDVADNVTHNVRQEKEIRDKEIRDKEIRVRDKDNKAPKAPTVYFPNDEALNEAFSEYVTMRKKIKAPMTDHAIDLAIKKLDGMGDADEQIKILNQSVMNSWKGLYPLKEPKTEKKDEPVVNEWLEALNNLGGNHE